MEEAVHILLVEDNAGDVLLTKEALLEGEVNIRISVVEDGEAALKFIAKEIPYESVNSPDLVLLDINLPRINGIEVLESIKQNTSFRHIPVVMLTTSSSHTDIIAAYEKHANCYITKPVELKKFIETIRSFENFWCSIVQLPPVCP